MRLEIGRPLSIKTNIYPYLKLIVTNMHGDADHYTKKVFIVEGSSVETLLSNDELLFKINIYRLLLLNNSSHRPLKNLTKHEKLAEYIQSVINIKPTFLLELCKDYSFSLDIDRVTPSELWGWINDMYELFDNDVTYDEIYAAIDDIKLELYLSFGEINEVLIVD